MRHIFRDYFQMKNGVIRQRNPWRISIFEAFSDMPRKSSKKI